MGERKVKLWYDADADLFEVFFESKPGYYEPTEDDRVIVRLDESGKVIGFSVLGARSAKGDPIDIELKAKESEGVG